MSDLTVIVVTYNSAEHVAACLGSCRGHNVIVVDNASGDNTVEIVQHYSQVRLIRNSQNRGFAAAVNQAVTECDSSYVLLLNPDVVLLTPVDPLITACTARTAAASGQLVDASGNAQAGFTIRRFPTPAALMLETLGLNRLLPWNPINRAYRYKDRNLGMPGTVDQPAGALLLFQRRVWEALGGFDESFYPVWFEDVDFCRRIWRSGYSIVYAPDVKARHTGGASVGTLPPSCRELYWYVSLLRYASKHYGALNFRLVSAAVALGSVLRASVGLMRGRGFEPALTYAKVIQVAGGCLLSGAARLQRPVAGPVSIQAESASEEATPRAGNTTNRNELHVL